ncbi:hypothetical protein ACP70R_035282 [Stipagrostis hirtigluma subsp. patula]
MARLPPLTLAALLFLGVLAACRAANDPRAVLLPVRKDGARGQYVTGFRQRTPLVPVTAVLDLAGDMLWLDCERGFASSTFRGVSCGSKQCRLAGRPSCHFDSCPAGKLRPSCLNDTCGVFPLNPDLLMTNGNVIADVLALPTTSSSRPAPLATSPAFVFTCTFTLLTKGLAAGATGVASLSRAPLAFPTQLAATFRFSRRFALCLPPAGAAGAVVFGDARYAFQGGADLSKSLIYTPLLVNPAKTPGFSGGGKSEEYFLALTGIRVNGRAVPVNATLLAFGAKGVGGAKLSTVAPYTVLETSIHRAVTDAFAAATAGIPRAKAVAPFKLCYDGSKVARTRVGPGVPTIELVLQGGAATWVVFGANSMVATRGGALCLGVVEGGKAPGPSVVIGGHMMEDNLLEFDLAASRLGFSSSLLFRQTNCNNFRPG